ncbi:MAG: hypothetical protein PHQ42_00780 [Patescibacteria group bacterium]|nr:hypothetical protein [Patescibacteria group bacterium]
MRLFSFKNGIIIFTVAIITILCFYWCDGYNKAKIQDETIGFGEYVKSDVVKIKEAIKEIPDILKESAESGDKVKIGSINKLAEALEIYNMEQGQYPGAIEEIIGVYINSGIIKEESFYYKPEFGNSGYTMGIELGNGETYEVRN